MASFYQMLGLLDEPNTNELQRLNTCLLRQNKANFCRSRQQLRVSHWHFIGSEGVNKISYCLDTHK